MPEIRLLLAADVHLDAPFTWAEPVVSRARRRALRDAVRRIAELAGELRVDALCFAGDLYEHERAGPDTGEFLRSVFAGVPCPVLLAPGNHDWYGPASLYAQVEWPRHVVVFRDDVLQPYELSDGFTVWGAAHRAPANTDGFLDGFSGGPQRDFAGALPRLGAGRLRRAGVREGAARTVHRRAGEARPGLRMRSSAISIGRCSGRWHTYPGNPEPLTFGEQGERGAVLISVAESGAISRQVHPVVREPMARRSRAR